MKIAVNKSRNLALNCEDSTGRQIRQNFIFKKKIIQTLCEELTERKKDTKDQFEGFYKNKKIQIQ